MKVSKKQQKIIDILFYAGRQFSEVPYIIDIEETSKKNLVLDLNKNKIVHWHHLDMLVQNTDCSIYFDNDGVNIIL